MTGTLFVVPTPLGNLEDITLRAIRVLREVDLVAAEDTRRSRKLLNHYDIHTRLFSYHQHTKVGGIDTILRQLESGSVALISDAGIPTISDPGFELIVATLRKGLRLEVLPGPSAVTTAVTLAAIPSRGFVFIGFLPRRARDMRTRLQELKALPYSLVLFEAPKRLTRTLSALRDVLGEREVVCLKEMSKVHEAAVRGVLSEVIDYLEAQDEPRGEWTLVIGPAQQTPIAVSPAEVAGALRVLRDEGTSGRDAVRQVSKSLGLQRSLVYDYWLALGGKT